MKKKKKNIKKKAYFYHKTCVNVIKSVQATQYTIELYGVIVLRI